MNTLQVISVTLLSISLVCYCITIYLRWAIKQDEKIIKKLEEAKRRRNNSPELG